MINHIFGLLIQPVRQWQKLKDEDPSVTKLLFPIILLAAIPPVAGYFGTTTQGWRIGAGDPVMLLYIGIPVLMEIPKERGFMFSTAILGFGMVGLLGMLVVTVLLWGVGLEPILAH